MQTTSQRYILLMKTVPLEDFSPLEQFFSLIRYDSICPDDYARFQNEILPKVEAILATAPVNAELIQKASSLKVIVVNGAGYDDIDIAAATQHGIMVCNIPKITAFSTAELAFSLMLSLSRRVSELDRKLREADSPAGVFGIGKNPGHTLSGKTLGIIGMGHIGSQVAQMAKAFQMNVVYTQRHESEWADQNGFKRLSMPELLAVSDIVSIHCPLNAQTQNLIGESAFNQIKPGALLINTARGAIIDQDQMVKALESGRLGGAAQDVFPNETEVHPKLLKMDQVILTPHIGTNTFEVRAQMAAQMIKVVQEVCSGAPLSSGHLINPEYCRR